MATRDVSASRRRLQLQSQPNSAGEGLRSSGGVPRAEPLAVEQLDAAQVGGLVELEVEGPHVVGGRCSQPSGGAVCEPAPLGFALRWALQAL